MFEAITGASVVASVAIALFFLRFWQQTRDRLFLIFALAFAVFAANRVLLSALGDESEAQTIVYFARALTFFLIALAIVDKNWPQLLGRSDGANARRATFNHGWRPFGRGASRALRGRDRGVPTARTHRRNHS
jgi:hypothetical protein